MKLSQEYFETASIHTEWPIGVLEPVQAPVQALQ